MSVNQSLVKSFLHRAAGLQHAGIVGTRLAIALVLIWIGSLKFYKYEADGIVPFVANSPLMSFFYKMPREYVDHQNKEGELNLTNRKWHEQNNTYTFSAGLGVLLIGIGLLLLGSAIHPAAGVVGSLLTIVLSLGTLSFLITTPESWVPGLGDADYGFPFLSGRGRLVIKDVIMLAGAVVVLADSARQYLSRLEKNE
jgi:uncharacterized membrane protein YkgB